MRVMLKSTMWEIKNREPSDKMVLVHLLRGEARMIEMAVVKIINTGIVLRTIEALLVKAWRSISREVGMPSGLLVIPIVLHITKGERGRTRYHLNL
jgi:hypothetical protein